MILRLIAIFNKLAIFSSVIRIYGMDNYPPLEKRDLPAPPNWKNAIGVGVVVMGLAIGTGELIIWPHIVTKYGLSLLWLALLGIGFQYFINKEIARHEMATGESFFTASARVVQWSVFFWLISAIVSYIWPGWAAAIGTILAELFGFGNYIIWSWITLAIILLLTFAGKSAYEILEKTLKVTVAVFFVLLVVISFINLSFSDISAALKGVISFGTINPLIDINILLSAVVFAGAGGMLNLAISLWYRDRRAGMGKYAGRITNPISGDYEAVSTTGYFFDTKDEKNMKKWRGWMRYANIDQGLIFFFLGFVTLFLLSVNAHATLAEKGIVPEGLMVAVAQANIFGETWGVIGSQLFLFMAALMLFSVAWAIIDALTRIITDIVYTNARVGNCRGIFCWFEKFPINKLYYGIIIGVVLIGAFLVPLKQPLTLLVISGVFSGLSMAVYTPLLIYINNTQLDKKLRPSFLTNAVMTCISLFFAYFVYRVVIEAIAKII